MNGTQRIHAILRAGLLFLCLMVFAPANGQADNGSKYLDAVREFADNVLEYGRDTYGPKHTPLFVDGLNIHNHEPVKWISPKGHYSTATDTEEWILCNVGSQQTLLRTLDALSGVTGDARYRQTAMDAIRYAFDHLRTPSGLFYWGHITAYDALRDVPRGDRRHESIKLHYPYYRLMWTVDPAATKKLIEALWCAHIMDWSNLDFNRSGVTGVNLEEPWDHEYEGGPTFFKSKHGGGFGFFVTGSSLIQAGTTLYVLSRQKEPLLWSKRLAKRFIDTRHPDTGISTPLYNNLPPTPPLGDDLKGHFIDHRTIVFPYRPFEETRGIYYPESVVARSWISLFLVGNMLGDEGKEFAQWALEELTAWGKAAYRKKDNSFVPILTDGTNIEGYVCKETNTYGPKGAIAKPLFADLTFFWGYATAYRMTNDKYMWQMSRHICLGNSLGDIGENPMNTPELQTDTTCSDVYGLLGFLELYKKTDNPAFLQMARRIGDNIIDNRFHKGFFVASEKHIYARFDSFEPLALLHLHAAEKSKDVLLPQVWPSYPLFVPSYRYKQEGVDRRIIYTLTESSEPPLSLQEAAAIGNIDKVRSLLEKGTGVDSWDDSLKKTALQRAAMSGHKDIVELLLAHGARIDAQEDFPGGTALDYAVENGHKEIVELLIAQGADVNASRRGHPAGDTPLHSAVRSGHKDIIGLLTANGADVNAKNEDGETPLDIAAKRGQKELVSLLIEEGSAVSTIHQAASLGDLEKVKEFIKKGADVNAKDNDGNTPLVLAASGGHANVMEFLIDKGADVNSSDESDWTPLHGAVHGGHKKTTEILVSGGPRLMRRTSGDIRRCITPSGTWTRIQSKR